MNVLLSSWLSKTLRGQISGINKIVNNLLAVVLEIIGNLNAIFQRNLKMFHEKSLRFFERIGLGVCCRGLRPLRRSLFKPCFERSLTQP